MGKWWKWNRRQMFLLPSSHLWLMRSRRISWFPVINARSNGVNPSLLTWFKCRCGCVSRMAVAFSSFSCSMALHKAEKWMSAEELELVVAEFDFTLVIVQLMHLLRTLKNLAFISPRRAKKPTEKEILLRSWAKPTQTRMSFHFDNDYVTMSR